MYVCAHVCMCVCVTHACVHVCVRACMCMYVYVCVYMHIQYNVTCIPAIILCPATKTSVPRNDTTDSKEPVHHSEYHSRYINHFTIAVTAGCMPGSNG